MAKGVKRVAQPAGNPSFDVGGMKGRKIVDPIRCGIVGLGRIGWSHHAQIQQQHPGFELVAVCDRESDRIAEAVEASGCTGYRTLAPMLKSERVELVVVATPSRFHEPIALRVLQAGKHVLVEKPAALKVAGIDKMIRAARRAADQPENCGVVFIKRTVNGFARRNDWQVLRKYGGGMTGNWGVHLVDQGVQLLGAPVKHVWGSVHHLFNPGDAEDDIKAIIEGKNGVIIDVDMTSVDASVRPSWIVCGTRGTLWIQDGQIHLKYIHAKRLPKLEPIDTHLALGRKYGAQPEPDRISWREEVREVKPRKRYESYYDNLYRAVREGAPLLVSPESARDTYDVLDRIKKGSGF